MALSFYKSAVVNMNFKLDAIVCLVDAKHVMQHLTEVKEENAVNESVQQVAFSDKVRAESLPLSLPPSLAPSLPPSLPPSLLPRTQKTVSANQCCALTVGCLSVCFALLGLRSL